MMETLRANACTGFDMVHLRLSSYQCPMIICSRLLYYFYYFAFRYGHSNKLFHQTIEILFNNTIFGVTLTKVVALPAAVVDHGAGHAAQRLRTDVEGLM